jgi:hypothetical protein
MKMSIRKGRDRKPSAAIGNWLTIVMVGMALLTAVSCQEDDQIVVSELEAAGTVSMSFWVDTVISGTINKDYEPVRLLVADKDKQIGEASDYGKNGYKITLPEKYSGKELYYIMEFQKTNSKFDGSNYDFPKDKDYIKNLVVGLLKSRYYDIKRKIPAKDDTTRVSLDINDIGNLKLGYGPNSLALTSVQDVPFVYLINLDTSELEQYGLTVTLGIAVEESTDLTLDLLENPNLGLGFASPETDWILLLDPMKYIIPGEPLTFWFIMERDTTYPYPCEEQCACDSICTCGLLNTVLVNIYVSNVPSETGSTISIPFNVSDRQCVQIPTPIPIPIP